MQNSKVVEINGIFVGAAVRLDGGNAWRFVAADARVSQVDGQIAATLRETQLLARHAFLSSPAQDPLASLPAKETTTPAIPLMA